MKIICFVVPLLLTPVSTTAGPPSKSWTKTLKNRSKRGMLSDVRQYVRGDSGKWNDDARLQIVPSPKQKPAKMLLDDWAEALQKKKRRITSDKDNLLLFHSRQFNDNDRLWITGIRRNGNRFKVEMSEAVWTGRYRKNFTYHRLLGVNLGKLNPGRYDVTWVVKPMKFTQFEPSPTPKNRRDRRSLLPKNERPAGQKPKELTVTFTVVGSDTTFEENLRRMKDQRDRLVEVRFNILTRGNRNPASVRPKARAK